MKPFGLKIEVIVIAFAIVFLAIFSGQMLLNHYLVNKPLDRMLEEANLLDYIIEDETLTLVWDGKNPDHIIDFLENKSLHKRFKEVNLNLEVNNDLNLWQEEELIIREGVNTNRYYTALERLRQLDGKASVIILEDNYLYVSFLNQGQLYSLENLQNSPIRLISKVVFANE